MMQRLPRWSRWLLGILAVLLLLYLIIYAVLTSTGFSRFVLNRVESAVPALTFEQVQGSFTSGLRFDMRYRSEGTEVQITDARLGLQPACLWRMQVCIEQLHIDQLRVALSEAAAETEEQADPTEPEAELPEISLPVDISLDSLQIGSLLIERDGETLYQLAELDSALAWRGSTFQIDRLQAADDFCRWGLAGEVTLINQYPLHTELACESVAGLGTVTGEISGDLEQLQAALRARVESDYTAEPALLGLQLALAPLDPELPARLRLEALEPLVLDAGGQLVRLAGAEVSAAGPLLNPEIEADLRFSNEIWSGENRLTLSARASTEQLQIRSLQLQLPQGQLNANGELDYGEALVWAGELQWQDLALEQFAEDLSGQVSGQLASQLRLEEGELQARVDLQSVSGTWLERQLAASGLFEWRNEQLNIDDFRLRQGDNRLQLAGNLAPAGDLDLSLSLNLPAVGELLPEAWAPDASGEIEGQVRLAGSFDNPSINSQLSVNDLAYGDIRLGRGDLQLQWFGLSQRRGELDLRLQALAVAEGPASSIRLQGQGNVTEHSLQLVADGLAEQQDKHLELQCSGGFASQDPQTFLERWQGSCNQLSLTFDLGDPQTWRLDEAIEIDARPQQPTVSFSSFCLRNQPARLCSENSIRFDQGQLSDLALRGEGIPMAWAEPFLPDDSMSVDGNLALRVDARDLLSDSPDLSASVSSSDLAMSWAVERQQPLGVSVNSLEVNWRLLDEQHRLRWQLATEESGSSRGELRLDSDSIAGEVNIAQLRLSHYARLFLPGPDDTLEGEVDADLRIAGELENPVLGGRLILSEGLFSTDLLPVPLRDIQLAINIDDNRALADGSFRAADSDGSIGGEFVWRQENWEGALTVAAEPLVVRPEPGMEISVAPDLKFNFAPGQLRIAGEVRVPQATIEVTELPEQAQTTSSDAVIVGEDGESDAPLTVSTNINVVLGDQVFFEGFGLETLITGNLRLRQSVGELMRANGRLQLVEGRYTAYGQNLAIRSGDLVFVGDLDNPQVRLEAVRADTPSGVTVGLRASGPARSPQISLFSQPDMPQQAQLSYLLTGNPPGTEVTTDPQVAAAEAALSYALESNVGTGITRRAGDALGIEDLQVTAGATEEGTQIGLSGYITPNLLVRYGVGVFDAINTLTLRYQLTKSVYLEAISGENSDVGVMWSFERD